ncbi:putative Zn-dependent protease with MMP-like domain/GNAT superfamily N-acetyltransferase [Microbacterium keratanolyticum]|nr:putative Zn-dependent protease with MMP-like domain/GNAT superfamily N-acetyltransferase [Microbacterium keratanolyticum]
MATHLRPASARDLEHLAEIERAADQRFHALFGDVGWDAASGDERAAHPGFLLVSSEEPDGPAVGFVHVITAEEIAHLEQLSVHPHNERRGHGTALLQAAVDEAARRGFAHMTLRTYQDVPWNAPFYERHGFVGCATPPGDFFEALMTEERRHGLSDLGPRITMRVDLTPPALNIDAEAFEAMVVEELDRLPDEMVKDLENVVFVVEDRPEDGSLDLLGLYDGLALTERGGYGMGELPDRIVLYREPHLAQCATEEELRDEIHTTLVHEIAHYFGIDDEQLHEMGWA